MCANAPIFDSRSPLMFLAWCCSVLLGLWAVSRATCSRGWLPCRGTPSVIPEFSPSVGDPLSHLDVTRGLGRRQVAERCATATGDSQARPGVCGADLGPFAAMRKLRPRHLARGAARPTCHGGWWSLVPVRAQTTVQTGLGAAAASAHPSSCGLRCGAATVVSGLGRRRGRQVGEVRL